MLALQRAIFPNQILFRIAQNRAVSLFSRPGQSQGYSTNAIVTHYCTDQWNCLIWRGQWKLYWPLKQSDCTGVYCFMEVSGFPYRNLHCKDSDCFAKQTPNVVNIVFNDQQAHQCTDFLCKILNKQVTLPSHGFSASHTKNLTVLLVIKCY